MITKLSGVDVIYLNITIFGSLLLLFDKNYFIRFTVVGETLLITLLELTDVLFIDFGICVVT